MKKTLTFLTLLTLSAAASAHPGHTEHGFINGILHPLTGMDHLLAMIAVGLWAASFAGKIRYLIPAAFIALMSIGFVLGSYDIVLPYMEQGIAASVLVLGLAAAWAKRVPISAAIVIVGAFALFHGMAHGVELHGDATSFALGFIISTASLHAVGLLLGNTIGKYHTINRLIGTAIGAIGLTLLLA